MKNVDFLNFMLYDYIIQKTLTMQKLCQVLLSVVVKLKSTKLNEKIEINMN